MYHCLRVTVFAAGLLILTVANSQSSTPESARLGFLLDRAKALKIEVNDADRPHSTSVVKLIGTPVLKYQNPLYEGQSDGVLLVWVTEQVPVAFASYSIRNGKDVVRELATVCDSPLRCVQDEKLVWTPQPGFSRRQFPMAPAVPESGRLRARFMKRLAEKFQSGNRRILPTPLYRYKQESNGVLDGAVFALSDTNDPEILVVIEAHRPDESESAVWRYALARMNSQPQKVLLKEQVVWELDYYWRNPKSPQDPYQEKRDCGLPKSLRLNKED